jgi:hypothetical protein
MQYEQKFIEDKFQEISEGQGPEEFLKEKCHQLIKVWLQAKNYYKQTGPYWEALKIILQKYAPAEYKQLENQEGDFSLVNKDVLKNYNYHCDEYNFVAALQYMQMRSDTMAHPNSPHIIEVDGEEVEYIPNFSLDKNTYHGRE